MIKQEVATVCQQLGGWVAEGSIVEWNHHLEKGDWQKILDAYGRQLLDNQTPKNMKVMTSNTYTYLSVNLLAERSLTLQSHWLQQEPISSSQEIQAKVKIVTSEQTSARVEVL